MMGELAEVLNSETLIARFEKVAPKSMNYEAEKGFAIQILNNNNWLAKVATGAPNSLLQAVTNVAAIGLSLNPAKKQAYLITRSVKVDNNKWQQRVFLEPSYMGLCDIATLSGCIEWVQARAVYESDTYENNGPDEKPTHKSNPFAKPEERGEIVGFYCTAKTDKGDYLTNEMSISEIQSIRDRSEAWKKGQSGPWKTDFVEMGKKTVVRNAFKMWPKTGMDRAERAVHLSNENEGFEPIETSPEIKSFTSDQKELLDSLIEKEDALGMHILRLTTSESVFTNLYHSFPKGQKGKYQKIVDRLNSEGRSKLIEYVDSVVECLDSDDGLALSELLSELTNDELKAVEGSLNQEQFAIYRELTNEQ
jgi:recombination protein RecT